MNQTIGIISKALSVLLYPLFVPTYGMALFCYAYSTQMEPLAGIWMVVAIIGTFILTGVLPITAIWILLRRGAVSSLQIKNAPERTMPYIYTVLGVGFWCYLLLSVALVAVINHWWKISAHLTGLGGLVGGFFSYCLGIGAIPTGWLLVIWFGISLLLMCARLHLNAHTPAQVCAGWLLGLTCTFIPYCIYFYAV